MAPMQAPTMAGPAALGTGDRQAGSSPRSARRSGCWRGLAGAFAFALLATGCHGASTGARRPGPPAPSGPGQPSATSTSSRLAAATGLRGRVAFSTVDGDLWVMQADGSHRRQLTRSGVGSDFDPSWSPDGRRLVFRTTRGRHLPDPAGLGLDGST
jgi:WD40-like Beta Propeller Repeat